MGEFLFVLLGLVICAGLAVMVLAYASWSVMGAVEKYKEFKRDWID